MKKVDKITDKVKFKAFGKMKPPTKTAKMAKQEQLAQGLESEEQKAKELLELQSRQIKEEINRIKMMRHGRAAKIFKMREIVSGPKKGKQDAHPVKNIKGDLVFSKEEIKKVNLEHCLETFKDKKPHQEAELIVKLKEDAHEARMKETSEDDFDITKGTFNEIVVKLT